MKKLSGKEKLKQLAGAAVFAALFLLMIYLGANR